MVNLISSDRSDGLNFVSALPKGRGHFVPLFLSAALIVGVGLATASTGNSGLQGVGQQGTQDQTKPPEVPKPVVIKAEDVTGVTYADKPGVTYVLARTLSERLSMDLELDKNEKIMTIGDQQFEGFRRLYGGNILVPIRDIEKFSGTIQPTLSDDRVTVECNGIVFDVVVGKKRIDVDKAAQELTAYQGEIVVLKTNVSTGRPGHNTPNGEFKTGPKERMHYSRKYNNAEMPYAVQVNGDVFFHGYPSVPPYPASHGCIRMPLGRNGPAKYMFSWVHRGIDVKIFGVFDWDARREKRRKRR